MLVRCASSFDKSRTLSGLSITLKCFNEKFLFASKLGDNKVNNFSHLNKYLYQVIIEITQGTEVFDSLE